MRKFAVVLVVVMLALSAVSAWAYPTLGGSTGLVTVPTAEVVPMGAVDVAVDYQKDIGISSGMYTMDVELLPIRGVIGLAEGLELWGGYTLIKENDWDDAKFWNVGAKYLLMNEAMGDDVSVAVGGSFGELDNSADIDVTNAFVVASKTLDTKMGADQPISAIASVGVMWLDLDDEFVDEDLIEPFLGVELMGERGASLVLEYRFKDDDIDDEAPFSAALRLPLGQSPLMLQVGTTNAGFGGIGSDDQELFIGVCYTIGGPQAAMAEGRTSPWGY